MGSAAGPCDRKRRLPLLFRRLGDLAERFADLARALFDLVFGDGERGREAEHLTARDREEHAGLADDLERRARVDVLLQDDAAEEAAASLALADRLVLARERREELAEELPFSGGAFD